MLKKNYKKKLQKKTLFIKINLKIKNIEKNIKFLKGPYSKIQIQIKQKFCGKPGNVFKNKKLSFKLAFKKKIIMGF